MDDLIRSAVHYYLLDSRLVLLEHAPGSSAVSTAEATCILQPTCTPLSLESVYFQLCYESLQQFHALEGRFVYSITGLRTIISPCGLLSRWKRLICLVAVCSRMSLTSEDADAITTAVKPSPGGCGTSMWIARGVSLPMLWLQSMLGFLPSFALTQTQCLWRLVMGSNHPGREAAVTQWAVVAWSSSFPIRTPWGDERRLQGKYC